MTEMTMDVMAHSFPAGEPEQAVTSLTLVNATTKTIDVSVPAGEKWLLVGMTMINCDDVARDMACLYYKEATKTNLIRRLLNSTAVATLQRLQWPNSVTAISNASLFWFPMILEYGNTLSFVWTTGGASTGATDADGLVIEYLRVPG